MASRGLSYHKLKKISSFQEDEAEEEEEVSRGRRQWSRLRRRRWRRPRLRVARLRRILRKKTDVVRAAVKKVIRRLKEGKPCFGELFAGNYMFMQVSPSPTTTLACFEKSFFAAHHQAIITPPSSTRPKP